MVRPEIDYQPRCYRQLGTGVATRRGTSTVNPMATFQLRLYS